jgi:hypothetical protein
VGAIFIELTLFRGFQQPNGGGLRSVQRAQAHEKGVRGRCRGGGRGEGIP